MEGIIRFIEGVESKTNIYNSYSQWYDDVIERMEHQTIYEYQKYLLSCRKGFYHFDLDGAIFLSFEYLPHDILKCLDKGTHFSCTLNRGWTHEIQI